MFPIRDINPIRIFPIITIGLIVANLLIFFGWQRWTESSDAEITDFLYENAAVACELTTGDPLSKFEIRAEGASGGTCEDTPGVERFPEKNLFLSVVVSMFLHGGLLHVFGNMWFLWIFGNNVEEAFGSLAFLGMYLLAGVAATAAFVLANPNSTDPLVGASGAIAGVLGAYLVLFPRHKVLSLVFFFFVPVSAVLFLGIWFFSQFGITDASVAWEAHVAGFLFGVVLTLLLRNRLLSRVNALHVTSRCRV
jgi:membrane associated rhomboid family serine protease